MKKALHHAAVLSTSTGARSNVRFTSPSNPSWFRLTRRVLPFECVAISTRVLRNSSRSFDIRVSRCKWCGRVLWATVWRHVARMQTVRTQPVPVRRLRLRSEPATWGRQAASIQLSPLKKITIQYESCLYITMALFVMSFCNLTESAQLQPGKTADVKTVGNYWAKKRGRALANNEMWWARDDSNIRPLLYQSSALTG